MLNLIKKESSLGRIYLIDKNVSQDIVILLDALEQVLSAEYKTELKSKKAESDTFYCDFIPKVNLSSKQFLEIEGFVGSRVNKKLFFIFTGISGIENVKNAQRISGKIFKTKEDLDNYCETIKLSKQFDHKLLGAELGIFTQDQISPGSPFWLNNGIIILELIKHYINKVMNSYERVLTPIFAKTQLWKKSGHYDMYRENMLIINSGEEYALKPMNCPLHVSLLKSRNIKKADLPIRLAEFGHCHRNEASGALNGLLRTRSITQDDAHIFCTEDQIEAEVGEFCSLLLKIYQKFGFDEVEVRLATKPEKFIGNIETWNKAEQFLASAITKTGLNFLIKEGDGAFYGPKIEFHIKDNFNRLWQCGTVQLDFMMAERLDLNYKDGDRINHPVIIHHAILGSLERFIAILLEQTKGWLPVWLAPIQVLLLPISPDIDLLNIKNLFEDRGIRYKIDTVDSLSNRVKRACIDKVPIVVAIGCQELESGILPVRINGAKEIKMDLNQLIEKILKDKP